MYENLRRIRKERGMTCEQIGRVIGVKMGTYSKKELEQIPFSLEDAKKISDFFGLPIEKIFLLIQRLVRKNNLKFLQNLSIRDKICYYSIVDRETRHAKGEI